MSRFKVYSHRAKAKAKETAKKRIIQIHIRGIQTYGPIGVKVKAKVTSLLLPLSLVVRIPLVSIETIAYFRQKILKYKINLIGLLDPF